MSVTERPWVWGSMAVMTPPPPVSACCVPSPVGRGHACASRLGDVLARAGCAGRDVRTAPTVRQSQTDRGPREGDVRTADRQSQRLGRNAPA